MTILEVILLTSVKLYVKKLIYPSFYPSFSCELPPRQLTGLKLFNKILKIFAKGQKLAEMGQKSCAINLFIQELRILKNTFCSDFLEPESSQMIPHMLV